MAVDRKEAGELLKDVAGAEQRVREFLVYSNTGPHLILWGLLWFIGYTATHLLAQLAPRWIGALWLGVVAAGAIASIIMNLGRPARSQGARAMPDLRPALAAFAFLGFGLLWTWLGHLGWREQGAFYPTFFGVLFLVAGLWAGRLIVLCGAALIALTLAGYFWSGNWFDVWMAVVGGGALIGAGLWLRS